MVRVGDFGPSPVFIGETMSVYFDRAHFEPLLKQFKEPTPKRKPQRPIAPGKQAPEPEKIAPYIAFGHYLKEFGGKHGNAQTAIVPHLFVLNIDGAYAQKEQIEYYITQKHYVPLKWHLPATSNRIDGRSSYSDLHNLVEMYAKAGSVAEMVSMTDKLEAQTGSMKATIEAQAARIAELEAKSGAKGDGKKS